MSISKISFKAEQNLLNKMQSMKTALPQAPASMQAPVMDNSEPKKDHKVRNWSIGLGSAAVLISLGVMGRKGLLGKGIQKALGGVKKASEEDVDRLIKELGDEIEASKLEKAVGDAAEPEILTPEAAATKAEVSPTASTSAEQPKTDIFGNDISKTTDEVLDIENINAVLNRTVPQIDKSLWHIDVSDIKPLIDELNSIDISKIEGNYAKILLPDGSTREITLNSHGKISAVFDTNKDGEKVLMASFVNGALNTLKHGNMKYQMSNNTLLSFEKSIENSVYKYNSDGYLFKVYEQDSFGNTSRIVDFDIASGEVDGISYIGLNGLKIKTETFVNNKLDCEYFFDNETNIVKKIKH